MKRILWIVVLSSVSLFFFEMPCLASWLVFHKPPFRGRVIDAEIKEPIKGAVVVVSYTTYPMISGPGGGSHSIIEMKETLTDENGEFLFPAYWTLTNPMHMESQSKIWIYKAGYGCYPEAVLPYTRSDEDFFSEQSQNREGKLRDPAGKTITFTYGVVELPRLYGFKERKRGLPSGPYTGTKSLLPLFFKERDLERRRLGLD
jgi:hypothetical protein